MADTGGGDPDDERIEPDVDRAALIRAVAEDVRGDSSQSEQLAAILYRVSDLYDPDEETTPEEIYRNVVNILRITERGTLERDP
jgi:flagellar biosynthesis protein FlhB